MRYKSKISGKENSTSAMALSPNATLCSSLASPATDNADDQEEGTKDNEELTFELSAAQVSAARRAKADALKDQLR
jgi:hypothetical protein